MLGMGWLSFLILAAIETVTVVYHYVIRYRFREARRRPWAFFIDRGEHVTRVQNEGVPCCS